jgi:hypothetical protein
VTGPAGVACPRCGRPLEHAGIMSGTQVCPLCGGSFEAVRFNPPAPDASVPRVAEAGPEGAHACPLHAGNAAVGNCARCGVFTCAVCRIEVEGRILCPACFERLADAGELPSLVSSYRDYGRAQYLIALLGLPFFFLGLVTGPASVYYGTKALAQMREAGEPGGRARVWALFALGATETLGCAALLVSIVR